MQQINFSPIDFSRIPQQEDEARRRQYQAMSDLAKGIGEGISAGADRWANAYQQELAEEWKKKQWKNQIQNQLSERQYRANRDAIADARYRAEIARRDAADAGSREAAEQLRQEFLGKIGSTDLSKYGPGAQFAMSRIQNARDWNDIVGAGESLASIIQYQNALDAQQAERTASAIEQKQQEAGPRLSQRIGSEMAASGLDLNNLDAIYASKFIKDRPKATRAARQATLDQLRAYRDQLVQFQTENPGMLTPEMQKQLNELNNAIRIWGRKMQKKPTEF